MTSSFSRHAVRELAELHRAVLGQQREHGVDRVAHARADRRDVRRSGLPRRPSARDPAAPRRAARRARPVRAGRARASGTAPRVRPCARPNGSRSATARSSPAPRPGTSCTRAAARAGGRAPRSASAPRRDRRRRGPGSSRRAFSSTSVAAISRNSVATSRSTRSMCSTSTQNTSTMCASEISQRSTSSFKIRCKRRSNGPSKTGVETSYGTGSRLPAPNHRHVVQRTHQRKRPGAGARAAGNVTAHGAGLLRDQTHRRHASRQLPRAPSAAGSTPSPPPAPTEARDHHAIFCVVDLHAMTVPWDPAELDRVDPAPRHAARRGRARRRPLAAVRAESRPRPRRAHLAAELRGVVRRAAAHDPVQGQERQAGRGRHRVGERRVLRLPGAHGLRHPVVRHRRGARRRRPAPARRARPRRRHPLQQPLRRHVRRPEGDVPRRRRAGHGPATPREQDVEVGGLAAGHDPRARPAQDDREEDQVGGHRLRRRGPPRPRREARRLEPDRDLRRGHRAHDRRGRAASSTASSTACSRSRSPRRSSSSSARCRSATHELAADPGRDRPPARASAPTPRRRWPNRCSPAASRAAGLLARPAVSTRPLRVASSRARVASGRPGSRTCPSTRRGRGPRARSRLTVPPPDAPWITTACALHHSTVTPTPMPTAARSDLAHAAGTRRVAVYCPLKYRRAFARSGSVLTLATSPRTFEIQPLHGAGHAARPLRRPVRPAAEADDQQQDEEHRASADAPPAAVLAAARRRPEAVATRRRAAVGTVPDGRLAAELDEVRIGGRCRTSVVSARFAPEFTAGLVLRRPRPGSRRSRAGSRCPARARGRWCAAAQATASGRAPAAREPAGAELVVVHISPDSARSTPGPGRGPTTVADDRRHRPADGAEVGLRLAHVVQERGRDPPRVGVGAERRDRRRAPSRPTRPDRRARAAPSTRAPPGRSAPRTNVEVGGVERPRRAASRRSAAARWPDAGHRRTNR